MIWESVPSDSGPFSGGKDSGIYLRARLNFNPSNKHDKSDTLSKVSYF
jgi:predicted phosphoadenosine phosphosulfate sulfurtransferase